MPSTIETCYADFCRVEFMIYKPFRHIVQYIGDSATKFITNWQTLYPFYKPWHQHRTLSDIEFVADDTSTIHETNPPDTMEIN